MRIAVKYFAVLREQRGLDEEDVVTQAATPRDLYDELRGLHGFRLDPVLVRVAVNGSFAVGSATLADGDEVVFIPPVAGG